MENYIIFTDSACDVKPEMLDEWGVAHRSLTFRFDGDEKEYSNEDMAIGEFYGRMRMGGVAKTAAVNSEVFKEAFEQYLEEGTDILYLGFSSGLSTTYNSARIAAEELSSVYPERKIITVDTFSASLGFGMVVYLTLEKKNAGATIEEAAEYAAELQKNMCHWFTVDDLVYLKRGGRVSPTVAFVGNLLGVKPVLHMDNEGHLINMFKVRGRKMAIKALADKYDELALEPENSVVFISHADCIKDAEQLAGLIKARHGVDVKLIGDVGTVIGAHAGPGTLALFFVGKQR